LHIRENSVFLTRDWQNLGWLRIPDSILEFDILLILQIPVLRISSIVTTMPSVSGDWTVANNRLVSDFINMKAF
jgi:hypothetical protein